MNLYDHWVYKTPIDGFTSHNVDSRIVDAFQ